MSGNSCWSALHTAPMVSDFACLGGSFGGPMAASSDTATSAGKVGELVLADLQLVPVAELVRLDPAAVDVGAVQRPRVVQEPLARAPHENGVVARHGDIVQEDLGVRRAPDRQPFALQ